MFPFENPHQPLAGWVTQHCLMIMNYSLIWRWRALSGPQLELSLYASLAVPDNQILPKSRFLPYHKKQKNNRLFIPISVRYAWAEGVFIHSLYRTDISKKQKKIKKNKQDFCFPNQQICLFSWSLVLILLTGSHYLSSESLKSTLVVEGLFSNI